MEKGRTLGLEPEMHTPTQSNTHDRPKSEGQKSQLTKAVSKNKVSHMDHNPKCEINIHGHYSTLIKTGE